MRVTLNGEAVDSIQAQTIGALLIEQKVKSPDFVSVELNGRILRREEYVSAQLRDGDQIELLYFMGGGHGVE